MAEKSGFFNARETEVGTYDREYDAEQFAEYFANFISDGVYANPANQLKVVFDDSPSKPFVVMERIHLLCHPFLAYHELSLKHCSWFNVPH